MAYGGKRYRQRLRNPLDSIHDPPDPSPRHLPDDTKDDWDEGYDQGYDVYQKKDLAKRQAWRNVKLKWRQTGKKTWKRCSNDLCFWPSQRKLPFPQATLVALGVLVEYVYLDQRGKPRVATMDRQAPPIMWWDDERKAIYAFPKQGYPACMPAPPGIEDAIAMYERWHQRQPQCYGKDIIRPEDLLVPIPDVSIRAVGAADSVSYASDKWGEDDPDPALRRAQEYIHNHWYDVWIWQDTTRGTPNVIMIQGGELDAHEKGLIH